MKTFIYILSAVGLLIAYVRYLEHTSVFYPSRLIQYTPAHINLPFEDIWVTTPDGIKINGWFIKNPSAQGTLLFLHGNAGNLGDRLGKIELFYKLGLNVFIIDYRGYGKSKGRPSEKGMYTDAVAAYDYLLTRKDIDFQRIVIYGSSLGGAAAVDLLKHRQAAAVILDSTFSCAADMAKKIYPFIPSFCVRIKLDSLAKIKTVNVPKLFIHSVEDEVVPYEFGRKLYDAAPTPKEFLEIRGSHEDALLYDEKKFTEGVAGFLKEYNLVR